jgi:DNA-binding NtrC family response regulator
MNDRETTTQRPELAQPRVLIADDQPDVLEALRLLLKGEGFKIDAASSPAAILEAIDSDEYDAVLMDLNYARDTTSGQEGLDLLSQLRSHDPTLPLVVMTAWGSVEVAVEAMRRGARDFVQKPWENARLLTMVRTQVELARALRRQQRLEAENRSLKPDVRPLLIAEAPSMRPVLELIQRVGPSEANVLVTGENGTGKGTVAQAIHSVSGRAGKGLVTVNAGGLSEGVFESELFGHVKGAFTRCEDRSRRPLRTRRRRHAVPRRNCQRAAEPAAEAAARARDRRLRARRLVADASLQRPHRVGDQLESRRRSRRRTLPPGLALPAEHHRDCIAAAARSA